MSVLVEFSMSPMDKGTSVSDYVARSLDIVSQSGLAYRLGPMGTCVEGDWKDVMGVIEKCYRSMSEECERISCYIKIDARAGKTGRINSKIAKVEEILGRKLNQ